MLKRLLLTLLIGWLVLTSFAQDISDDLQITLPISLYLLVDNIENPDPDLSTSRTEDGIVTILENMNTIWSQANIELELNYVGYVEVPTAILDDITIGDFMSFFNAVANDAVTIPDIAQINGFYVKDIGGPNGITLSSQVFFVNDAPTVNDERVSSHEVGHILGLHHELLDNHRLMFSGTNGTMLNEIEVMVARYFATGFLRGVRR